MSILSRRRSDRLSDNDCGQPLTSCWSKSHTEKKHPYYLCQKKGCVSSGKSIRRAVLEDDFANVLRSLKPMERLFDLDRTMFEAAWNQRQIQATARLDALKGEVSRINKQIECLLDRIVEASTSFVITAYETHIAGLEQEKLVITEKLENGMGSKHTFEGLFELAFGFLKNSCKLWDSGQLPLQRMMLRLAFSERISYCRDQGLRTAELSKPFKVLTDLEIGDFKWWPLRDSNPDLHRRTDFKSAASTSSAKGPQRLSREGGEIMSNLCPLSCNSAISWAFLICSTRR